MDRRQVLIVNGGSSFDSHEQYLAALKARDIKLERMRPSADWKSSLQGALGDGYDVLVPRMPNSQNAQYAEWVILFEKALPFMRPGFILVGHSLGGIFLAKYLAGNALSVAPGATILVAAPFDEESPDDPLGSFRLPADLSQAEGRAGRLYLMQSDDDPVVAFGEMAKYQAAWPSATSIPLTGYQHVNGPAFPELVELVRSL
jgi:predicted alpha/beta hydrolase family esterase